jgi:hypothetical protein
MTPQLGSMPSHRPPRTCPVCTHDLVVTGLGCPDCGTSLNGAFKQCSYCGLDDTDLETLRVFLVSRGNMREVAAHLGVSYPTARQRYAELLQRLGLGGAEAVDREKVLEDLAAGRISVDDAEVLLAN